MGEYRGFPPERHEVDGEQFSIQSGHRRMMRFEAVNVKMWVSVVLLLLITLGILIALVLGVRMDVVLESMR